MVSPPNETAFGAKLPFTCCNRDNDGGPALPRRKLLGLFTAM